MAATFNTWESYLYPPPDDHVLRNRFDEHDPNVLRVLEYGASAERQRQIERGAVAIERTYDSAHLRAIHWHLFQDVYDWAGEYRSVNIAKGSSRGFADVTTGEVDRYLGDAHRMIVGQDWVSFEHEMFARRGAEVFAYVNQAHPFREGNGRSSKVFMEHVAERSRFMLDYSLVPPEIWNEASKLSRPDLFSYKPVADTLVPVFRELAQPRAPRNPS